MQMAFKFGAIAFYLARRIYKGYKEYKSIKQFRRVTNNVMARARRGAVSAPSYCLFMCMINPFTTKVSII